MTITLERAIEIGARILAIESAIDQGQIGYTNKYRHKMKYDFYENPLFSMLSNEREKLRRELIS